MYGDDFEILNSEKSSDCNACTVLLIGVTAAFITEVERVARTLGLVVNTVWAVVHNNTVLRWL